MNVAAAGRFSLDVYSDNRRRRRQVAVPNGVTIDGVNYLAGAGFLGAQRLIFYFGLIAGGGFSRLRPEDTNQGHPGWVEWGGWYGRFRPEWMPADPQAGVLATRFAARFVARAGGTIRGGFLSSSRVVGPGPGVLYCTGVSAEDIDLSPNDFVEVTYTLTLSEAP